MTQISSGALPRNAAASRKIFGLCLPIPTSLQVKIFHEAAAFLGSQPNETWVVEDGLYAMKTARAAGFHVLGVYDESSSGDWEEIQQTASLAMKELTGFDIFWEAAAE